MELKKTGNSSDLIFWVRSRGYPMPETSGTIMKIKLCTGISWRETMSSSTGNLLCTKLDSCAIRWKFYQRNQPSGWTMPTAKAIMQISMGMRWTCMQSKLIWQKQRHNFVWVTSSTRVPRMGSPLGRLCRMASSVLSIWACGTASSRRETIVNCCTRPLSPFLGTGLKTQEYSSWSRPWKSRRNYGQANSLYQMW